MFVFCKQKTAYEISLGLVVASEVVYGMARMYALMRGENEYVRVFRTVPDAEAWLGSGSRE